MSGQIIELQRRFYALFSFLKESMGCISQQASRRITRHTLTLVAMLTLELLSLTFAIWFATSSYKRALNDLPVGYLNLRSLHLLHMGTLALFGVASATVPLLSWLFTRRVIELTKTVRAHTATESPVVALEKHKSDEIGDLVDALNQLGQAYETSLQRVAKRADELAALNRIASIINETLDLQRILDVSLDEVLSSVNFDKGGIYLWDPRQEALNLVSYRGFAVPEVRDRLIYTKDQGTVGRAARTSQMVLEQAAKPAAVSETLQAETERSAMEIAIPLTTVPGQLLGVLLVLGGQLVDLDPSTINLLKTIAHQMSFAIDKAQLYQQVMDHAIELERVVAERTQELHEAVQALEAALRKATEADELKSSLLLTVSHELRTPLTTIMGCTEMLAENHNRLTAEQLEQHLWDIAEEANKLTELVCNLLDMSRIESGMLHFDFVQFDLQYLLDETIRSARIRFDDRPLNLEISESLPACIGDPRRIQQVVDNLLNNADKFSPPQEPILVRAEAQDEEMIVSVIDRGLGIPPEHLTSIFDRFVQLKTRSDSGHHGIGLGLSICHGIVSKHNGRIWAESELGKGSSFSFALPRLASVAQLGQETIAGTLVADH